MSTIGMYAINDFSVYLMPKQAAPACPPCQSNVLKSVFEDDEEDVKIERAMSLRAKLEISSYQSLL
ncbi:hypothetical protein PtA15_18A306 [Puccinia triticina]|uniref:Uncharacterized protein n=1 Tax=Puccinia triticina TaxID=208348 RepID=A0ABY7D6G9_9BASI|nr:uncharacterized protein PtA15_18A306 [Puccinia triticina]WAQ93248.1 hypothetical protein PtA15_18A306 [Puccinia triticina]WAR63231.1 hypothetical protein PtB15_18B313 [Puccinia triticina]